MKKLLVLMMVFFGTFLFAAETQLMPNGINPEAHKINTTWGTILFFMWPILIIIAYKFVEFTLKKSGLDKDL